MGYDAPVIDTDDPEQLPLLASIVVPTYQRPRSLRRLLQALCDQKTSSEIGSPQGSPYGSRETFEVIVVDDGGGSSLRPLVDGFVGRLDLFLIEQSNAGPAAARNRGARMAQSELLVFIDDDCEPTTTWLCRLAAVSREFPRSMVGGQVENLLVDNLFAATSQLIVDVVYDRVNDAEEMRFFTTNNLAVSTAQFRELGGFNPHFRTAEDREFCMRWRAAGWHLHSAPGAVVFHAHDLTFFGFCRQHFNYGRGAWDFHRSGVAGSVRNSFKFHRDLQNWLTHPLGRRAKRPLMTVVLLVVWQATNSLGLLWQMLLSPLARRGRH